MIVDYDNLRIRDFVTQDNTVHFSSYKQGYFWYCVKNIVNNQLYCFPVPLDDIGTGEMLHTDKSLLYMRWIRAALVDKTMRLEEPVAL